LELPPYIVFDDLIAKVDDEVISKGIPLGKYHSKVTRCEGVNYRILHNKDGQYAWRPFELIHPVLYVLLVHIITDQRNWERIRNRFHDFSRNDQICCLSLPVKSISNEKDRAEQVSQWWQEVEQKSVALSLEYDYILQTDITDCYGAVYTHSIAWALHGRESAKNERNNSNLVGNNIDAILQEMHQGQTNGIPQGSVLMDFVAEIVLGYADMLISECLEKKEISDYKILRYRDDYRVFVNNPQIGSEILKVIAEKTTFLNFKLNPSKTQTSSNVIRASIKGDRLAWMARKQGEKDLQKHLLIIHEHSLNFPNSGSLVRALNIYHARLSKKPHQDNLLPLIAIVVDIAYRNPRAYSYCATILSKLLSFVESDNERNDLVTLIHEKFRRLPNTGHMEIWLQRLALPFDVQIDYDEPICKLVADGDVKLWNNEWLNPGEIKNMVDAHMIVDAGIRDTLPTVIDSKEVELFLSKGYY